MVTIERSLENLGLGPDATPENINQAYRDLAMVWHPDRFPIDSRIQRKAERKLKEINEAFEVLRDYDPAAKVNQSHTSHSPQASPVPRHHDRPPTKPKGNDNVDFPERNQFILLSCAIFLVAVVVYASVLGWKRSDEIMHAANAKLVEEQQQEVIAALRAKKRQEEQQQQAIAQQKERQRQEERRLESLRQKAIAEQKEQQLQEEQQRKIIAEREDKPRKVNAEYQVGYLLLEKEGRIIEASEAFSRVIELDPEYARAYIARARCYNALDEPEKAIQDCESAIRMTSNDRKLQSLAYSTSAFAHLKLGKVDAAIEQSTRSIQQNPANAYAFLFRSEARRRKGETGAKNRDFETACKIDPAMPEIRKEWFPDTKR